MLSENELTGPHWRFALDTYLRPGVSGHCLHLQDTYGVDVNVLLMSLHAAVELCRDPSVADIAALDAGTADHRENVVKPLRRARRQLKEAGLGDPGEKLRSDIKKAEVRSEQLQQGLLVRGLAALPEGTPDPEKVARRVVAHFAGARGNADRIDQDIAALDAISAISAAATQAGSRNATA